MGDYRRIALNLALGLGFACLLPTAARAQCNIPGGDCIRRLATFQGTVDFFATGASFAGIDGIDFDRPAFALDHASVEVPARRIPVHAKLRQAYLYWGGSIFFDNDGDPETPVDQVELQVPGSSTFAKVRSDVAYQTGAIPDFPEVILYAARADVTNVINAAGGQMVGTYSVRDFRADVFYHGHRHTIANASFSIVLIFEEPRLPPRQIVLFDGDEQVYGSTVTLDLAGFTVSQVPSGSLTFYVQEGDCNPDEDCPHGDDRAGLERVRVIGQDTQRSLVLTDSVNPPNDIFNRTINTTDPPQRNVVGTDIDQFDISSVLKPGDQHVTVEITSPLSRAGLEGDFVSLAYTIIGIDVFAPELRVDSRIRITDATGAKLDKYLPGQALRVSYEISNTGNLPATGVHFEADMPDNVVSFAVATKPEGANVTVTSDPKGGPAHKGSVIVDNLEVRNGEVNALSLLVSTVCPLAKDSKLVATASVGAPKEGGNAFTMTSSVPIAARDRCGPSFYLYGGGGCSDVSAPAGTRSALWIGLGAIVFLLLISRRARAWILVLFTLLITACGTTDQNEPDRPPPDPIGTACPGFEDEMVFVPSLRGAPSFCIDRYEASVASGDLGNMVQTSTSGDGSTTAVAKSARFTKPARMVSWYQAHAACLNAHKRMCSADEWVTACRGDQDLTYPYGEDYDGNTCNGFEAARGDIVESGAMITAVVQSDGSNLAFGCVSQYGAYDMSGNVWEWNATAYLQNTRRGLAGGSFRANRSGLRCVTDDNNALPGEPDDAFGFRCCVDGPK
jgi:hypothetical protein